MFEELIIAGYGGQGIMFSGTLLAYSAMEEGLNVTFFPSYGAEMRGGTANCRIVIAKKEIGSPIVKNPSSLIVFNKPSLDRFAGQVKDKGLLIINSSLIKGEIFPVYPDYQRLGSQLTGRKEEVEIIKVPANDIAERLGNGKTANMVALGTYIRKKGIVSLESVIRCLQNISFKTEKKNLIKINEEALKCGFQYQGAS